MNIDFTSKTKELLNALHFVRHPHSKRKKVLYSIQVIMELYEDSYALNVLGAYSHGKCQRKSNKRWKINIPLDHFYQIIKSYPEEEIKIIFEDGKMICGKVKIGGISIKPFGEDDEIKNIELPINCTNNDLLKLRFNYSEKALLENGILGKVEQVENKLNEDLAKAHYHIKKYGILNKDLMELIQRKLK